MNCVTSFLHDAHWCSLGLAQLYPIQHTQWSSLLTCNAVSTRQPNPTCRHPRKAYLAWVTSSLAWHSQQIRLLYTSSSGRWSDYGYQPVQPTIKTMQFSQWRCRADSFRCLAAGTAVASVHPRSPGSQTEGESEAPHRRPVWACSPRGRPLPRVRGAARPPVRRNRETLSRSPRSRRRASRGAAATSYPKHGMRAQPLARSPPGTRWRSLPGRRGRPRVLPQKTTAPITQRAAAPRSRRRALRARPAPRGRAACWASSFSKLLRRRSTGGGRR